jgi:hypothetical protein
LLPCDRYAAARHDQRAEHTDADCSHQRMLRPPTPLPSTQPTRNRPPS